MEKKFMIIKKKIRALEEKYVSTIDEMYLVSEI